MEGKRETSIYCSSYLCIHGLILARALTGDQTHNLGIGEQHSNQLSYLAMAQPALYSVMNP